MPPRAQADHVVHPASGLLSTEDLDVVHVVPGR